MKRRLKDSEPSTESSTPTKTDLSTVFISEENRFDRKGYGLFVAITIALAYFLLIPKLLQTYWPLFMAFMERNGIEHWHFFTLGIWSWHLFWLAWFNGVMYLIYHIEHPFFEKYKINNNPWPWYENLEEWKKLYKKSIFLIMFNNCLSVPALLALQVWIGNFAVPLTFAIEDLPDTLTLLFSVAFNMICEDSVFYFMHKLVHTRLLYPYMHKHHHNYITAVSIAGEHFHPIDFFFAVLVPGSVGPNLLGTRMHITTYLVWIAARIGESIDGHCGYEFSWSPYRLLPFAASAEYHDFHHSHNVGNFAAFFSFWDTIFGDNSTYYRYLAQKAKLNAIQSKLTLISKDDFNKKLSQKLQRKKKAKGGRKVD